MKGFPDLPPIWWLGSIALIYIGKWALPGWHIDASVSAVLSWALLFSALGLIAWSGIWFWRKKTPIEPHNTPKSLIIEGPYRLSRNPIYLSLVLLTLASAAGHGSLIGLAAAIVLWRVLNQRFAAVEETLLLETFGTEASQYLASTRRWI